MEVAQVKTLLITALLLCTLIISASENQSIRKSLTKTLIEAADGVTIDGGNLDIVKAIRAVIQVESMGNPKAINKSTNCYGLMQIENNTYNYMFEKRMIPEYKWNSILDPAYNIYVGIRWLDWTYRYMRSELPMANKEELFILTLVAYNKGVGATIKEYWSNGGKPAPSYRYYNKFLKYYRRL